MYLYCRGVAVSPQCARHRVDAPYKRCADVTVSAARTQLLSAIWRQGFVPQRSSIWTDLSCSPLLLSTLHICGSRTRSHELSLQLFPLSCFVQQSFLKLCTNGLLSQVPSADYLTQEITSHVHVLCDAICVM